VGVIIYIGIVLYSNLHERSYHPIVFLVRSKYSVVNRSFDFPVERALSVCAVVTAVFNGMRILVGGVSGDVDCRLKAALRRRRVESSV